MTEPYFLGWDIQIPNANNSSVSKWFQRWHVKDYRALLPLWGHSNPNWTRPISIEMIAKMTEPYILSGDIQLKTEKDCSVLKWFQRWQTPASFVGTFKIQLKKTVQSWKDFKARKTLHTLWGHSNPDRKRQFSIEMITRMTKPYFICCYIQIRLTEPYLTSFVGTFKVQLKQTVQYRNDFKDDRILHPLEEHSISNWKRLFSIEMISKMTEHYYILWGAIQIPTKKDSLVLKWLQRWQKLTSFVGIFQFPTEEDSLVLKWLQNDRALHSKWGHSNSNWLNLTSFVGTFRFQLEKRKHFSIEIISNMTESYIRSSVATVKFQLKNAVRYRNDFENHRTLHPSWEHSNPSWKRQFNIEMNKNSNSNWKIQILTEKDSSLQRWQNLTYFMESFKFQLKKTVQH